ncbi:DUF4416 family protein [candidate division WOR-3 bacterium]|nr:DUF4416 family protein [candidate division WOR-3 bacterium]
MKPVKLIVGIIARNPDMLEQGVKLLEQTFGPVELKSPVIPWDFSNYYQEELGKDLLRSWVAHQGVFEPDRLISYKKTAIALEGQLKDALGRRQVNLDPGILSLHNLILATTKDYSHRIYLGDGIYAEVTLIYQKGGFQPLAWTYPDYRTAICLEFLRACRNRLLEEEALRRRTEIT